MKWSPILHGISATAGIVGALALISWWTALLRGGTLFGMSAELAFDDAVVLFLMSIAFGIGTLIHQREEERQ